METLRAFFTLAAFGSFMGVVWWAYAPVRKELWEKRGELNDD